MPLGNIGRPAKWLGRNAKRAARVSSKVAVGAAGATARGAGRAIYRPLAFAGEHPRATIGLAAGAGLASAAWSAAGADLQEMVTGDPQALRHTARSAAKAILVDGWDPNVRNNPFGGLNSRGDVWATSSYLYGRNVQGGLLGDVRGSRVLGGYNMPPYAGRARGSGRAPVADGSMVFGMHNLRR